MPELPEVETIVRGLRSELIGEFVVSTQVLDEKVLGSEYSLDLLHGYALQAITRRGKLLLLHFSIGLGAENRNSVGDSVYVCREDYPIAHTNNYAIPRPASKKRYNLILAVHLKMTGQLFVYPKEQLAAKHTRAIIQFGSEKQLFFNDVRRFGTMYVFTPELLHKWPFFQELGLEPLNCTPQAFRQAFSKLKAPIKSCLLNQKIIAGVGNIYADESLFKARINPATSASKVTEAQFFALYEALVYVLKLSIEQCGSSIRDYKDAHGNVGSFQNSFYVYGRYKEQCRLCSAPLEKIQVAGRTTIFCPVCQKLVE